MTNATLSGTPSPFESTEPDALPGEAWRAIDLLDGERIRFVWATPTGFLVLTDLRCFGVHETLTVFAPRSWVVGPEFFLYNVQTPAVVLGRFVQLREGVDESGAIGRFAVRDPAAVAETIRAGLASGRAAWELRRRQTEASIESRRLAALARIAHEAHPAVMIRCSFCGNLVSAALRRCPSCGAQLG